MVTNATRDDLPAHRNLTPNVGLQPTLILFDAVASDRRQGNDAQDCADGVGEERERMDVAVSKTGGLKIIRARPLSSASWERTDQTACSNVELARMLDYVLSLGHLARPRVPGQAEGGPSFKSWSNPEVLDLVESSPNLFLHTDKIKKHFQLYQLRPGCD